MRFFTDGNVLLKVLVLQGLVGICVVWFLKKFLDHELFLSAMEQVCTVREKEAFDIQEVVIVAAGKLSVDQGSRLTALVKGHLSLDKR